MGATGVACAGIEIATMKATATILIMFSSQGRQEMMTRLICHAIATLRLC
jgi:hypothetical protein